LEARGAEHLIHHHLEVVAGVPVAVEVDGAGGLEHAVHLNRAVLHPVHIDLDAALPPVLE